MEKRLRPIKLKVDEGEEAWMYVNEKSIQIYMYVKGENIRSCKIPEKLLRELIEQPKEVK